MTPTRFYIGKLADGAERWAGVDPNAHHLTGRVCERRFAAWCAPYRDEEAARAALEAAGCEAIEPEPGRKRRGR